LGARLCLKEPQRVVITERAGNSEVLRLELRTQPRSGQLILACAKLNQRAGATGAFVPITIRFVSPMGM
jgi:hypothetical protein